MSDVTTPTGTEATPQGTSIHEAVAGLFDDLAADPEFADTEATEQPTDEFEDELVDIDEEDDLEDVADDFGEDAEEDLEDDESEDGENDEEQDEALYEVTLPGGEKAEVTLEELRAGYSRTEDYTRKRQADAETHRQAMAEVSEVRERYDAVLQQAENWLRAQGPQQPDPTLRQTDPGEYAAQMAEYQAFEAQMQAIGRERGTIDAARQQELNALNAQMVQQEWGQLLEKVPEWKDDAVRMQAIQDIRQHGIDIGFTAEEIDSVVDHRLLLMLKENMELKQGTASAKKVVEKKKAKASKRLQPGSSTKTGRRARTKKSRRMQAEADQLAAQTGSVRDAARAIELALAMEEG